MKRGGRKFPELPRDLLWRNFERFGEGTTGEQLGKQRAASNRSDATAGFEASLGNASIINANCEFQDVATGWIGNFDRAGGGRKFTGVAWILEVVENRGAIHYESIARGSEAVRC